MEISISFKTDEYASPLETKASIVLNEVPLNAMHRVLRNLPHLVAESYSQVAAALPLSHEDREGLKRWMYRECMYDEPAQQQADSGNHSYSTEPGQE